MSQAKAKDRGQKLPNNTDRAKVLTAFAERLKNTDAGEAVVELRGGKYFAFWEYLLETAEALRLAESGKGA